MASNQEINLGKLLGPGEGSRDAIHIAIAPVIAEDILYPGQEIGLNGGNMASIEADKMIGIVDPFLKHSVPKGERFWLFLFPNTITSLHHVWEHPSFQPCTMTHYVLADDTIHTTSNDSVAAAKDWIAKFAERMEITYDGLMRVAHLFVECRHYEYMNSELYKDCWDQFPEFWKHYATVIGKEINVHDEDVPFTCAC